MVVIKDDETIEKKYWGQKKKLQVAADNATLKNWEILSAAQKLGKQRWGTKFTIVKLAVDMEVPYSTCQRCLALNKANKTTWDLIKTKKLSASRAAMVLQTKDITYQDEIVKMVIDDKLTTYQIKTLQIKQLKDVKKEKQRLAAENGYSRKSSAYLAINAWIGKGKLLLLMNKSHLPANKLVDIETQLKSLRDTIDLYIK